MTDLRSAPLPPLSPDDHVRGPEGAPLAIVYGDYECPFCAQLELRLRAQPLRIAFRHFPVRASHPRAQAAAHAAEAAAAQGAFWPMHDSLFDDQGRLEDPHLWARAEALGLDLERFEADRRSQRVADHVKAPLPRRRPRGRRHDPDAVPRRSAMLGANRRPAVRVHHVTVPNDAQLMERLRADATGEALRELYRAYAGELLGFALNALGERGAAEEIVQEVFTRAWRHADRYDPARGSVRTWLYQITRHAIIDMRRRASARPALAGSDALFETAAPGDSIEQAMLGWQVAAALERLTPEHRQMIRLAHFQGLSVREIAERCELPIGTVKSRTWYALRSLRLALEEMGVVP